MPVSAKTALATFNVPQNNLQPALACLPEPLRTQLPQIPGGFLAVNGKYNDVDGTALLLNANIQNQNDPYIRMPEHQRNYPLSQVSSAGEESRAQA